MIVVSDTSPISNLIAVGHIDLLRQLFSKVVIPPEVYSEICRLPDNEKTLNGLEWITVQPVHNTKRRDDLLNTLDSGEAEAIVLALELNAEFILIDERIGRSTAESLGLRIVGILGILIEAKNMGLVPAITPIIHDLVVNEEFRLSDDLVDRALRLVGER